MRYVDYFEARKRLHSIISAAEQGDVKAVVSRGQRFKDDFLKDNEDDVRVCKYENCLTYCLAAVGRFPIINRVMRRKTCLKEAKNLYQELILEKTERTN